jgi:lipoyl(octanoyl) transferase
LCGKFIPYLSTGQVWRDLAYLCGTGSMTSELKNKTVVVRDLGMVPYKACWDYQETLFNAIIQRKVANRALPAEKTLQTENCLLLVEHPHVYTLGKSGDDRHLLLAEKEIAGKGATFFRINRGGDITYHGPGQMVAYPILDLDNFFTDIHRYLRLLEEAVILTLAEYGVTAGRIKGQTGVWLDEGTGRARKICAMGVRCSRWVTMHGLAFNLNTDLSYFDHIVPCGIADKRVTSLQKELGHQIDEAETKQIFLSRFSELFEAVLNVEANSVVTEAPDMRITENSQR